MSDSDSDSLSSTGIPSDDVLEKGLRDTVARIFAKGNMEELTVKRVRAATEKALELEEGFYKGDEVWKGKSDAIIKGEAERQDELAAEKEKEKDKKKASPVAHKRAAPSKPKAPPKRAATSASQSSRKRRKTATPSESEEEEVSSPPSEESEEEEEEEEEEEVAPKPRKRAPPAKKTSKPAKQTAKPAQTKKETPSSELSDVPDESEKTSEAPESKPATPKKEATADRDDSESEMSVLIDDEPQRKAKRRKSSEPSQTKPKKQKPSSKVKDDANADPDQAEIKKLQGQLVKCGIRKMWYRELAPYDTPKAKIKHLRQLLKDAGMEGRFSNEKANAIREQRELQADLEVVREGAKRWGTGNVSDDEEAGEGGRPRRRVARGFQALNFLGDDDGEETD
ncbi:hypothetical protein AJ79_04736 [Helicocarpus griseus UAMH5409]|uniref:Transcriptional regulator n=1 Tax=Helicocarpus griseus UAMH5409 TaxID=1447875 RepID=A0A2B7XSH0_9EURO|nr:hypothetical protein AJ79_04736 [Helicocarpus griseus UAMH5409]